MFFCFFFTLFLFYPKQDVFHILSSVKLKCLTKLVRWDSLQKISSFLEGGAKNLNELVVLSWIYSSCQSPCFLSLFFLSNTGHLAANCPSTQPCCCWREEDQAEYATAAVELTLPDTFLFLSIQLSE